MTDETVRTPYAHKIRYGVTSAPHLPSVDLPEFGVIPTLVELIYSAARDDRPARVSASVTGYLTRDGKKVRPVSQVAQHYSAGPNGWPEWLAAEARLHAAGIRDAARQASGQATAVCHPHGYAGECPCPPNGRCCKVAPADPTTADDPTPLRWGLGDVLHSDDDSVIVCLSGPAPDYRPYWLELEPERAAALRDDLANPHAPAAGLSDTQPTVDRAAVNVDGLQR